MMEFYLDEYEIQYKNWRKKDNNQGITMMLYLINRNEQYTSDGKSPPIVINDSLQVEIKFKRSKQPSSFTYYARFDNKTRVQGYTPHNMVKFSSKGLGFHKDMCTSTDIWQVIWEEPTTFGFIKNYNQFDVDIGIISHMLCQTQQTQTLSSCDMITFAPLYEDEELTDFELRGEDGDIRVHRAVLAAASPVLRRMLCGTWKETTEGHVKVQGTSQSTLQHLKDYIYLHSLPETGLEKLLLLGSCYMMHELEEKCVDKIVDTLTPQNACDMLEFAAKNKLTRLLLTIMEALQKGKVQVQDIRKHVHGAD